MMRDSLVVEDWKSGKVLIYQKVGNGVSFVWFFLMKESRYVRKIQEEQTARE